MSFRDVAGLSGETHRDLWVIVGAVFGPDHFVMKRLAATSLWFFVGWYLGSVAAWTFGLAPLVAPAVAVALAALVFADPRGMLWARPQTSISRPDAATPTNPEARGV